MYIIYICSAAAHAEIYTNVERGGGGGGKRARAHRARVHKLNKEIEVNSAGRKRLCDSCATQFIVSLIDSRTQ